ncbi:Cell division protein FtsA [Salmonella enterica subsp. enterica serovar Give str. S5-487]|nr:Cell division protein FtsA [Salmonella enterica subsp. enterica serovar Give str. S5-487]
MPALTQHSTSITLFRISAAMFLNYLTIGIPLVMLPLYVQQQLHLSDLLIGIAVGSQFIATLLTRGAAGRKADTSGGRRTVITGQFYCAASGLLMLVSLIAHPVPLLAWAILIVGRVLLGIGESFILTGNLTWGMWLAGSTHAGQVISWNGMATYGALAIGAPLNITGLTDYAQEPYYSTAVGLLHYGKESHLNGEAEVEKRVTASVGSWIKRLNSWLRKEF